VALVHVDQVLVHPAVRLLGGVVVEHLLVVAPAHVAHAGDTPPLDPGSAAAVGRGQPAIPHVRWLDHVVVDADDPGDLDHARSQI
jgi:hypothetical protein